MDVKQAIEKRRAYRSLDPVIITEKLIDDLATHAGLAPSCFNNQPWRYIFVYDPVVLAQMHTALSSGNEWVQKASLIIVVLSKKEFDCVMKDGREYYQFDTGIATAFLILRATELGLVAHPIAGYNPKKAREILGIPDDLNVITLVNVGKHADKPNTLLSKQQAEGEKVRPKRKSLDEFVYRNRFTSEKNQI
ncbi:MAG: nitroreductase family protein [Euryarchaeota archaeon]|nr:nitroreductase family protein [Euryarchaeota archaeon]